MSAHRKILVVCFALFLSSCSFKPVLTGKGDMSREIKQKAPIVFKADISPDGRFALSGGWDSFILWDIRQGKKIQTFAHPKDFLGLGIVVAFSPDGKHFASGGKGTKLWNLSTRQEIMTFDDTNRINSIAFSPDGKQLICGGDRTMKIFDVATGREIVDFKLRRGQDVWAVAYSPDGKYVLSGDSGGKIDLWNTSLEKSIRTVEIVDCVWAVSFSADGEYALSGGRENSVRLWNAKNLTPIKKFVGHKGIWSVAFSPDGKYALSAGIEGNIDIWDLASGTKWRVLAGHTGVSSVQAGVSAKFFPNGKQVISAGDASTRIWDVDTGEEVASMIAFEDGEWIITSANGYYNSSP